jgi:hypothetical protein
MTPENESIVRGAVEYSLTMLQAFESNPLLQYSGAAPGVKAIISQLMAAKNAFPPPPEPAKPADPTATKIDALTTQMSELAKMVAVIAKKP